MQGTIAQLLSLATYGNLFLETGQSGQYFPQNNTFAYCQFVHFVDVDRVQGQLVEKLYADSPTDWFGALRYEGITEIRVRHLKNKEVKQPDRLSVGFPGGGGRWLIECLRGETSDYWEGKWEVADHNAQDGKIWMVKYGRIMKDGPPEPNNFPFLDMVRDRMESILLEILDFSTEQKYPQFSDCFMKALSALNGKYREEDEYQIAPEGYLPEDSEFLLSSCQAAWIFGGVDSWNHLHFADPAIQKRYEELSDKLFDIIHQSPLSVVNFDADNPYGEQERDAWWRFW